MNIRDLITAKLIDEVEKAIGGMKELEFDGLCEAFEGRKTSMEKDGEPVFSGRNFVHFGDPISRQIAVYAVEHHDSLEHPAISNVFKNFDFAKAEEEANLAMEEVSETYEEYMNKAEEAKQEYMQEYGVKEGTLDYDIEF